MTPQKERALVWWTILIILGLVWTIIIILLRPLVSQSDELYNPLWIGPQRCRDRTCVVVVEKPCKQERKLRAPTLTFPRYFRRYDDVKCVDRGCQRDW